MPIRARSGSRRAPVVAQAFPPSRRPRTVAALRRDLAEALAEAGRPGIARVGSPKGLRYMSAAFATFTAITAFAAFTAIAAFAQDRPVFRSGTDLVRFDLRVVDAAGQPIRDLSAHEIEIRE